MLFCSEELVYRIRIRILRQRLIKNNGEIRDEHLMYNDNNQAQKTNLFFFLPPAQENSRIINN